MNRSVSGDTKTILLLKELTCAAHAEAYVHQLPRGLTLKLWNKDDVINIDSYHLTIDSCKVVFYIFSIR